MSTSIPPGILAALDQHSALCNDLLDELIRSFRMMLDTGVEPAAVAVLFARSAKDWASREPGKAAEALAYALVRLALDGDQ